MTAKRARATPALIGAMAVIAASGAGCQRSAGYQRDQDYFRGPEGPQSYYATGGGRRGPTQRLVSMGQPKKRVYVLNFWNDTPVKSADVGAFAADELKRGLHLSQRVIVPFDIRAEHGTEEYVRGDRVRVSQLIREGRKMGVAVLAIGRIGRVVFRQRGDEVGLLRQKQSLAAVDLEVKLFDVGAGREIAAVGKSGEASSSAMVAVDDSNIESPEFRAELTKLAVRNAVGLIGPDIVRAIEKLTWEGHVAKVVGTKIYINAGRASGLVTGDILKVLTSGDDVYDPNTGAYLGRSQGQLKGTVEVKDFIGTDATITELHTGGNFQEGDSVQLY